MTQSHLYSKTNSSNHQQRLKTSYPTSKWARIPQSNDLDGTNDRYQYFNEMRLRESYRKKDNEQDQFLRDQIQYILNKMNARNRSKSKSNSPTKLHHSHHYNKNLRTSPIKQNISIANLSPSPKKYRLSPSKTFTEQLQQIDHPSKNISITGYYPVGIEISPTGKYASSRIRNVCSPSFGSPRKRNDYTYNYEYSPSPSKRLAR